MSAYRLLPHLLVVVLSLSIVSSLRAAIYVTGGFRPEASVWTNGGDPSSEASLGSSSPPGAGRVEISGTSTLEFQRMSVGSSTGRNGVVEVSGPQAHWITGNLIYLGRHSKGEAHISGGAKASAGTVYIGINDEGFMTVEGTGSLLEIVGELHVGRESTGKLALTGGGRAEVTDAYIGHSPNTSGELSLTGPATSFKATGDLYVGYQGHGKLMLTDASLDVDGTIQVTTYSSATGLLQLDNAVINANSLNVDLTELTGQGSIFTKGFVGKGYPFTLDFDGAATAHTTITGEGRDISLTVTADSNGEIGFVPVTVRNGAAIQTYSSSIPSGGIHGSGSRWTSNIFNVLAPEPASAFEVSAGGQISSEIGRIGCAPGMYGALRVTGTDSQWVMTRDLYIGTNGKGSLEILDGGLVHSANAVLADFGGQAEVLVSGTGSTWEISGSLEADGSSALVTLHIVEGGMLEARQATLHPTSSLVLSGPDSRAEFDRFLVVRGQLTVANGALVRAKGTISASDYVEGPPRIRLAGGALDTNSLYISSGGLTGTGTVRAGGLYGAGYSLSLDFDADSSTSTVLSNTEQDIHLIIDGTRGGNLSADLLTIRRGAAVRSEYVTIGSEPGIPGRVVVEGEGSHWETDSDTGLFVGFQAFGELLIRDGATVVVRDSMSIGKKSDASGAVTITGPGSLLEIYTGSQHGLYIGGGIRPPDGQGQPSVTVANGAVLRTARIAMDSSSSGNHAILNIMVSNDGMIQLGIDGYTGTIFQDGEINLFADGQLAPGPYSPFEPTVIPDLDRAEWWAFGGFLDTSTGIFNATPIVDAADNVPLSVLPAQRIGYQARKLVVSLPDTLAEDSTMTTDTLPTSLIDNELVCAAYAFSTTMTTRALLSVEIPGAYETHDIHIWYQTEESGTWQRYAPVTMTTYNNRVNLTVNFSEEEEIRSYAVTLVPGSGRDYASWRHSLGYVAPNTDPESNPDGDRLNNLAEYAFASGPLKASSEELPTGGGQFDANGGYLTLTYRERLHATDINYLIEHSPDLETWTPYKPSGENRITSSISADLQEVTVRYPISDRPAGFLRLRVED